MSEREQTVYDAAAKVISGGHAVRINCTDTRDSVSSAKTQGVDTPPTHTVTISTTRSGMILGILAAVVASEFPPS